MSGQFSKENLNTEQLAAVQHCKGPILVIAGAGSGKTRVLTHRVANLIREHKVRPGSILAVTFTNKATQEMRERLEKLLGEAAERVWIATFHSMCLRILRRHATAIGYSKNFVVYDDKESKQVIKGILDTLGIDPKKQPPAQFIRAIDSAKNAFISPEEYEKDARGYNSKTIAQVYDLYQKELKAADAMDFSDLLVNALALLKKDKSVLALYQDMLEFVLVDEFQDTNKIQYDLIRMLSQPQNNVLVVGDDDQSIYAFRGATIENILNFEKDYPAAKVVKLEQNYRSTQSILEAAHGVIAKNRSRKPKKLWTDADQGAPIYTFVGEDESSEASFIARQVIDLSKTGNAYRDMAVFYRTNAQSRALEEAFMDREIPYRIYGGLKFYDRKEIKDIIAYLRMLISDLDNQAFLRTLNNPTRGIGAKTLMSIVAIQKERVISLYAAAEIFAETNASVRKYVELIKSLRSRVQEQGIVEIIQAIINETEYTKRLGDEKDPVVQSRIENLKELQGVASAMAGIDQDNFNVIRQFLDRIALASSADIIDEGDSENQGCVSFMTLHLAKGLEFPFVFFTGLEQGLCPHSRSLEEPKGVEEERRLCYVGITRAMKRLYLSRSRRRSMFSAGSAFGEGGRYREPSCFIYDIPKSYLESLGGDFFSSFDFEEDDMSDEQSAVWQRSVKQKRSLEDRVAFANSMVSSADSLSAVSKSISKKLAPLEQIQPGIEVIHPSFGQGQVKELFPAKSGDISKSKVTIVFNEDAVERKLVLGKARLALSE